MPPTTVCRLAPLLLTALCIASEPAADTRHVALATGFAQPASAWRPWVWAHWLHGNVDRAAITRNLEAMARVGLGGFTTFDVKQDGIPQGPHAYLSPGWLDLYEFQASEAKRLGLEMMAHNGPGYSGNGGPWITHELAAQQVVTSSLRIDGGKPFTGVLPQPKHAGSWYRDIAVLAIAESDEQVAAIPKLDGGEQRKRLMWLNWVNWTGAASAPMDKVAPPERCVPRAQVIVVTDQPAADGAITWDAPPGRWTLLRCGHAWTGQNTLPAPTGGLGPECDKLDPRGVRLHHEKAMQLLANRGRTGGGPAFLALFADSWEAGGQNWTARMREEFRTRRGYDPLPFLPVLTGRVVDDLQTSERFLYDLRQTVSELATVNFWAEMRRLCHADGVRIAAEPYITTGNDLDAAEHVDEVMGEFWTNHGTYDRAIKLAASVANLSGRLRVGCEAFTANEKERWRSHPADLKAHGDRMLCLGANRFQVHRFAMQRFPQLAPGMMMGPWGQQYDATQTWWEWTRPWHDYLARCQYLLAQGLIATDVLWVVPEEPLWRFEHRRIPGFDYDACGPDRFATIAMQPDGRPGVAGGPTYALVNVTHDQRMTLARLTRIRDLLQAGATVLCDPPVATPGLDHAGTADAALRALVAELWGPTAEPERKIGNGRLLRGMTPAQALARIGVTPDTIVPAGVSWIHRRKDGVDWWFVAQGGDQPLALTASLRSANIRAERWDPETGAITPLAARNDGGRTLVDLTLGPAGSAFIVLRPGSAHAVPPPAADPTAVATVDGPWTLRFPADSGAPPALRVEALASWGAHADATVRAFSGTAVYATTFTPPPGGQALWLDLGRVEIMARVKLNGTDLGICWRHPYRVRIDAALRHGANDLEITVVNRWISRLVADAALPQTDKRAGNGQLQEWPDWALAGKPIPGPRRSFVTIPLWKATDTPPESGLIGPVRLLAGDAAAVRP